MASTGRPARFADFLALVDAGRLPEILDRMDNTGTAKRLYVPPPAQRELKKNALGRMLAGWAVLELVPSGRATLRHSWSGFGGEMKPAGGADPWKWYGDTTGTFRTARDACLA
ncbi:hypothetical protein [Paractinoplanes globisporus]|uniref:Uncharacterized protein n=1 Tax=Paractinoplanes globisporus TaxID=113565 RepID=A0ABW6WGC8_9ACTN|nr:hypothetical protein [Actinoplanes globisporus]